MGVLMFLAEFYVSGEPVGRLAESLLGVEEKGKRKGKRKRFLMQRHDALHYK